MRNTSVNLADRLFPEEIESEEKILNIPPEQRRLNTETYDFTVSTINSYIDDEHIQIPKFQRGYVWNRAQASRLIESLIIQCPIPVVYLSQNSDETLAVIDGNQRLNSIHLFMRNEFPLQGLTAYPELDGFFYEDLDPRFRRHISNRTIRCIVILKDTHPQIKFDVFERLNTGSVKLNAQELRHGVYHGKLMNLLSELAKDKRWQQMSGLKRDKRMKSEELILRFLALSKNWRKYEKPLSGFLTQFADENANPSDSTLNEYRESFQEALSTCDILFASQAFKTGSKSTKLKFNAALYDAQMISVMERDFTREDAESINKKDLFKDIALLMKDETFNRHISQATTDRNAIHHRIKEFLKLLKSH